MPLGQPPQDEQRLDGFARPSVPGGEPAREPILKLFEPGDDPKGWDRASLRLNTHPLHPTPRLSQADLLLPKARNLFGLLAESLLLGAALAVLCYFPLLIASVLVPHLQNWVWGTMGVVGCGSALLALVSGWSVARKPEPY
ncbi:MAG TPA: hypothetical protein VF002_02680 [Gaiellaceae bacterium]